MGLIGIIFFVTFIGFVLFGTIEISGREVTNIFERVIPSLIGALIISLFLGLPLLGILSLLGV